MTDPHSSAPEVASFAQRVAFHEDPEIFERLEALAASRGHSLSAEIRFALRFWLQQHEDEP